MAKQLFKSSEKSNFILNMTEEKYSSITSKILFFTCIAVSLFTLPYELSENVGSPLISGDIRQSQSQSLIELAFSAVFLILFLSAIS